MRKGISPLIATVLILGFTVALAAIIITWGLSFSRETASGVEESALKDIALTSVTMGIRSAELSGDQLRLTIENTGRRAVEQMKIRIHGSDGADVVDTASGLDVYGIGNFNVSFNTTKVGAIEKVEVVPVVSYNGEDVVCSNCAGKIKDVKLSNEGLVLYMPLDSNTNDYSGKNNHGTNYGAVQTPNGKVGGAYIFGPESGWDYINIPITSYAPNAFTMTAWVYINGPSGPSGSAAIVGTLRLGKDGDIGVTTEQNPRLYVHTCCINSQQFAYYDGTSLGRWYHVAGVYDGASTMRLYIDGTLAAQNANSGKSGPLEQVITIGKSDTWNQYVNGIIDEVRIYERALSYSEIKTRYKMEA